MFFYINVDNAITGCIAVIIYIASNIAGDV